MAVAAPMALAKVVLEPVSRIIKTLLSLQNGARTRLQVMEAVLETKPPPMVFSMMEKLILAMVMTPLLVRLQ